MPGRAARSTTTRTLLAAAACALLALTPAASADQPAPLADLVGALNDGSFAQRERATAQLKARAAEVEPFLTQRAAAEPLTPEQRARLSSVLEDRFYNTPRAGLGVQFAVENPNALEPGVTLQRILPEFPASATLQPGDVIVQVEGVDITPYATAAAMDILRAAIVSYDPEQTIPLLIRRGAVEHLLDVRLGDYRRLQNGAGPQESDLMRGWLLRQHRLGLAPDRDKVLEPALVRREWPQRASQTRINADASVVGGGRSFAFNFGLIGPNAVMTNRLQEANGPRVQMRIVQDAIVAPDAAEQLRERVLRQIEIYTIQRRVAQERAEDPAATDAQRRVAAIQVAQFDARLEDLREQLAMLDE